MIEVEGPDGVIYEFPDGTDREVMRAALQRRYAQQMPAQQQTNGLPEGYQLVGTFDDNGRVYRDPQGNLGAVSAGGSTTDARAVEAIMAGANFAQASRGTEQRGFLDSHPVSARANEVVRGVPFVGSWADEAVGLVNPQAGEAMRYSAEAMQEQRPWETAGLNLAGGVAGAVPMALAAGPALAARAPVDAMRRAAAGAAVGGLSGLAEGAVFGAGEGEGNERVGNAINRAAIGAGVGVALPVASAAASHLIQRGMQNRATREAIRNAPTRDELRQQASEIFNRADNVGGMSREGFVDSAQGMIDRATRSGLDRELHPQSGRVAERIMEVATDPSPNMTFRELDILRRQSNTPARNVANPEEAMHGSQFIEGLDDFLAGAAPSTAAEVADARAMWGMARRSEMIEDAIYRAQNYQSGFASGISAQFKRILDSDRLRRGFNQQEIQAMERIVRGSASGNLIRQLGKAGLGASRQSTGLVATMGAGVGGALGGVPGAMAVTGAGSIARAASERSAMRSAENVLGLVGARNALAGIPGASVPAPVQNALNFTSYGLTPMTMPWAVNALAGLGD